MTAATAAATAAAANVAQLQVCETGRKVKKPSENIGFTDVCEGR